MSYLLDSDVFIQAKNLHLGGPHGHLTFTHQTVNHFVFVGQFHLNRYFTDIMD